MTLKNSQNSVQVAIKLLRSHKNNVISYTLKYELLKKFIEKYLFNHR